jgi:HlyD family secretion protein
MDMDKPEKIENIFAIRAIICALILLAGAGGAIFFAFMKIEPPKHKADEIVKVLEGENVESGSIQLEMTGYGTVQPVDEIKLSAEIRGRITTTNDDLSVGLVVKKGDILATIDQSDYKLAVIEAEANLVQLQEEQKLWEQIILDLKDEVTTEKELLALTDSGWKRHSKLLTKRAVSQEAYEKALQNHSKQKLSLIKVQSILAQSAIKLKVNKAKIKMVKAKLDRAKTDLRRSEVKAPINGRLTQVYVDDDEYVTPGTPICILADDTQFDIPVSLDAKIASKVFELKLRKSEYGTSFDTPEGVEVIIEWPESAENCRWIGRIKRIMKFDPETRTFVLIVTPTTQCETKDRKLPLVAGMFCRVTFKGKTLENAVKIPWSALQLQDQIAVVDKNSRLQVRNADIILVNKDTVIISNGIKPGEKIITQRLPRGLINGMKIKVMSDKSPTLKAKTAE